jgi:hypothetical protein
MDDLQEKLIYHQLYDLYGNLLTDKQRAYFSYYYLDDYSLSEIAKIMSVSRNAVHEQLKTVIGFLEYYEEKLGILEKKNRRMELFKQIRSDLSQPECLKLLKELEKGE